MKKWTECKKENCEIPHKSKGANIMNYLFGTFNMYGYEIVDAESRQTIYQAGNCPQDSQQSLEPGTFTLDLNTLQQFCNSTGKELAADMGLKWHGCKHVKHEEVC